MKDVNGVTIATAPVTWATTNAAAATVTSTGIVTGVGQGLASVIASSGSVADTQLVTVETQATIAIDSLRPAQLVAGQPATIYGHNFSAFITGDIVTIGGDTIVPSAVDSTQLQVTVPDTDCAPAATRAITVLARGSAASASVMVAPDITPVTLAVGQVAALAGAGANCVQFAANTATAQYLVIIGNVTSSEDASPTFEISTTIGNSTPLGFGGYGRIVRKNGVMSSKPAARAKAPTRPRAVVVRSRSRSTVRVAKSTSYEAKLRAYERSRLAGAGGPRIVAKTLSVLAVGDTVHLNVPTTGCDSGQYTATTGVVEAVGAHGILVQDAQAPSGGFADTDFTSISNEYDNFIYSTDSVHFGGPSDIDANQHVILYFTPQINKLVALGDTTDGFFFAGDLSTPSVCPESNQGEIIYLAVPDPNGTVGTAEPTTSVRQLSRTTLAHQMQHLINAGNRLFKSNGSLEEPWLNEGLSYLSEDFVGRAEYAYTDLQQLTFALVDADANTFAAFFQPNAQNYANWLTTPYAYGAVDSRADSVAPVGGAAWSMLRYAVDQYSGGVPAALTRALAYGPNTGVFNFQTSITAVSGAPAPLDSVIEGWLLASYTSGAGIAVASKYTFLSYNMRDVQTGVSVTYPLVPDSLAITTQVITSGSGAVQGNGGFYINLASVAPVPAISLQLLNGDGTAVSFPGARIYILRIQ